MASPPSPPREWNALWGHMFWLTASACVSGRFRFRPLPAHFWLEAPGKRGSHWFRDSERVHTHTQGVLTALSQHYHCIIIAPPQLLECNTSQWRTNVQLKLQLHLYQLQRTQQNNQINGGKKLKYALWRKGKPIEPGIRPGSTLVKLSSDGESWWSWRGWRVIPK